MQPVTVLATLRGQALTYFVYFLMSLKKAGLVSILVFFSSNIIGLDLGVTIAELLTAFYNMLYMNISTTSRNFWRKRDSTTETIFEDE